jgi:adenosine kinase
MGVPYIFDPGQQIIRMTGEELKFGVSHAHALFVNEYEFQLLEKNTGMSEEAILTAPIFTVVTLGENGSRIHMKEDLEYLVPVVKPERILDPTGVGDAYRGGFLRGYLANMSLEICGKMGALAATYCLEQNGTQNHSYSVNEFLTRFRIHFDDKHALDAIL